MDTHIPWIPSAFINRQYHTSNIYLRSSTRRDGG